MSNVLVLLYAWQSDVRDFGTDMEAAIKNDFFKERFEFKFSAKVVLKTLPILLA